MWKKLMKISCIFALALILVKPMVVQAAEEGTDWDTAKGLKIGTTTIVNGVSYYYYENTSAKPVVLFLETFKIEGESSDPSIISYVKSRGDFYTIYYGEPWGANSESMCVKVQSGEKVYFSIKNDSSLYTGKFQLKVSNDNLPSVKVGQKVTTTQVGGYTLYIFTAPETGMYMIDYSTKDIGEIDVFALDQKYWIGNKSFSYDGKFSGLYLVAGQQYGIVTEVYQDDGTITWDIKKSAYANNPALTLQTIPTQLYTGNIIYPTQRLYYKGYDVVDDLNGECNWYNLYANRMPGMAVGVIQYNFDYAGSHFSGYYYTTFRIAIDIGAAQVTGVTSPVYTGKPVAPKATVMISGKTLKEGVDYKIVADNNVNAGAGRTATIQGLGNYAYSKQIKYTITKGTQSIQANPTIVTYKKAKKFALGATASGALSYASSNTKVATIDKNGKVKPKNYGKTIITIQAAATSNVNATGKKVTVIVTSKPTKVVSAKSNAKKKATVKIKKATGAQGYEISYSLDPEFKSGVKTVSTKKVSTTLKKLKSKKTYYVRVRSYRKVKGEKLYSTYSDIKKVKIK